VRLTAAILAGPDRTAILERNTAAIEALVPALAYTLALPALLHQDNAKRNAAELHLESLHALSSILPLPLPQALTTHEFLCQGGLQSVWARHMRLGVGMTLRGKAAAVQRHSALQLAAAMVALLGPRWLFYPLGQSLSSTTTTTSSSSGNEEEGGAFYQLLLEVVKVETNVLLHDALSPTSRVPLSSEPGTAAKNWQAPNATYPVSSDEDIEIDNNDKEESIVEEVEEIETIERSAKSREEEDQGEKISRENVGSKPTVTSVVDGIDIDNTSANTWAHGPSETAGERALQMLPCCFLLLEACIEALAEDNDDNGEGGGSDGGMLSDSVAQRALASLLECVDVLLQVLEEETDGEKDKEEDDDFIEEVKDDAAEAAVVDTTNDSRLNALKLGAVRVLGRFFAEVPDAFEERVQKLLPRLLAVSSSSFLSMESPSVHGGSPTSIGSPRRGGGEVDSMLDFFGDFVHKVRSPRKSGTGNEGNPFSSSEMTSAVPSEGIAFFLPMLLQVTEPARCEQGDDTHMKWIEAIVKGGSLRQLVDFAVELSEVMEGNEVYDEDMESSFMTVCRVLLQIITQIEHLVVAAGEAAAGEGVELEFAVADASWPLIPSLTEILTKYFAISTPTSSLDATRSEEEQERIACVAALLAAVMEAVADEADHPDEAHRSQQELFTRKKSTKNTQSAVAEEEENTFKNGFSGMGPLSGRDVQHACEVVLHSTHLIHSHILNTNSSINSTTAHQQLKDDFRCLVDSARRLVSSCSAFKDAAAAAAAVVENSAGVSPEDLFKGLSL
jgi:hypothetical protein